MRTHPFLVRLLAGLVPVAALATHASAAEAKPPQPQTVTMTIRPQPTTRPALKHRLMPAMVEQTPGDAGPLYLQAAGMYPQAASEFADKTLTDEEARRFGLADNKEHQHTWSSLFMELPLEKLRAEPPELRTYLGATGAYGLLEAATRRETVSWHLPIREQGFATLLPHLNSMRGLSRRVCVQARLHLAKGEFDAALRTLQINFAMARALDAEAVLVQQLVGAGVAAQGLTVLQEAVGLPGFPNLYWALADLPTPMFDVRQSLEMERAALYWTMPALRKARDGTFTDADWRSLIREFSGMQAVHASSGLKAVRAGHELEAVALAVMLYPSARLHAIGLGTDPKQVDEMPKTAVVAQYMVGSYEEAYDEMVKWASVPYWQGRAGLERSERSFAARAKGLPTNPLLTVVPAVIRATFSIHRLERLVAAQQTAEALRAHAAAHGGALPKSLDELTDLPAPPDPFTGKPFVYRAERDTATLESLSPERPADGLVVKVTVAK